MKKLLITSSLFIGSISCWGQFNSSVSNIESTGYPKEVQYLNKNELLYVFDNATLISSDGGKNFELLNNGFAYSSQFINESTIVNTGTIIRITKDRGLTWVNKYLIQFNGDTTRFGLHDFSIFNNGYGFVTGYKYGFKPIIFLTKNYGETWIEGDTIKNNFSVVKTGTFSKNYKMYRFDSIAYKMRKDSDTLLVKYYNFGDSAVEIDLKKTGIKDVIKSYAFQNKDTGLFVTQSYSNLNQHIYLTTNGCKTFIEVSKPNGNFIKIDYAKSTKQKKGFYIGTFAGNNIGGTAYTYDYGQTWITNIDPTYLFDINFYDAENGIASAIKNLTAKMYYFTELTNSINQLNLDNPISIYPNPSINNLNIKGLNSNFNYKIINLFGQVVLSGGIKNMDNTIDISTLKPSTYLINLETESGSKMYKFIKTAY